MLEYYETGESGIDLIRPLWEQLNRHHLERSPYFKDHYARFTFEERKADLLLKAREGRLYVCLASDEGTSVGYVVSTLTGVEGEIDSIYVSPAHRGRGVGDVLMTRALAWLDTQGALRKKVEVGAGNEDVFRFYARYGFYPRKTTLLQKDGSK